MKKIICLVILFINSVCFAQLSGESVLKLYKSDNAKELQKLLTKENIDDCIEIKEFKYSLLALAIKTNRPKIFKMLLQNKVNVEKACASKSPLMYAAKYNNLEFFKKLIDAGANYKSPNYKGRTAKDYAKKYGSTEVYEYLKTLK